jgi:hypothetical protein
MTVARMPTPPSPRRRRRHAVMALLLGSALLLGVTPSTPDARAAASSDATDPEPAAPAPDAEPSPGPRFAARAAFPDAEGRRTTSFRHALEPSGEVADAVELINFTSEPMDFALYSADMVATTTGTQAPAPPFVEVVGAGTWIDIEQPGVTVVPGGTVLVPFSVVVPAGTLPGAYDAAILVEPQVESGGGAIQLRTRVGLRVEIEVLGAIDLALDLGELQYHQDRDGVTLQISVTNTGNVSVTLDGEVVVSRGSSIGRVLATLILEPEGASLAPGVTRRYAAIWDAPPIGRFTARATVNASVGERASERFESEPVTFLLLPWAAAGLTAGLAGILAFALIGTRDARHRWLQQRREERALVRDFRQERRNTAGPAGTGHRPQIWTSSAGSTRPPTSSPGTR